jgi:hypothetical protein
MSPPPRLSDPAGVQTTLEFLPTHRQPANHNAQLAERRGQQRPADNHPRIRAALERIIPAREAFDVDGAALPAKRISPMTTNNSHGVAMILEAVATKRRRFRRVRRHRVSTKTAWSMSRQCRRPSSRIPATS